MSDVMIDRLFKQIETRDKRIEQLESENDRIVAESKQCHLTNDELVHEHLALKQTIEQLEREIRGFAGGTVYRQSHEDISKELGALRRYATSLLEKTLIQPDRGRFADRRYHRGKKP